MNFFAIGTKIRSYSGIEMDMNIRGITGMEGPWDLETQEVSVHGSALLDRKCLELSQTGVHEDGLNIIGSIQTNIFVSSTCVTVLMFQGPGVLNMDSSSVLLTIAARSKNL